ncbi:unnamed protein product [Lota lota]
MLHVMCVHELCRVARLRYFVFAAAPPVLCSSLPSFCLGPRSESIARGAEVALHAGWRFTAHFPDSRSVPVRRLSFVTWR